MSVWALASLVAKMNEFVTRRLWRAGVWLYPFKSSPGIANRRTPDLEGRLLLFRASRIPARKKEPGRALATGCSIKSASQHSRGYPVGKGPQAHNDTARRDTPSRRTL